jgi:hypothetical protein
LHVVTAVAWKRRRHGSGSSLWRLLREEKPVEASWHPLEQAFGDVPHAIIGAVAANQYMPARQTADVDFAVAATDRTKAEAALQTAGWTCLHELALRPPLTGWAWQAPTGRPVEVIIVPSPWGEELVAAAMRNRLGSLPMATLPHLVALKMVAARAIDAADITRMLGHCDDATLELVRAVCHKVLGSEEELKDLEQLIELGRLEYGIESPGPEGPFELGR